FIYFSRRRRHTRFSRDWSSDVCSCDLGVVETANIILQGVVVASPSYNSSAVLKINDQVDRYRVGEMLANSGFELAEVYWDRVILRRSTGATQEVLFKGLENGLNQPIVPETS